MDIESHVKVTTCDLCGNKSNFVSCNFCNKKICIECLKKTFNMDNNYDLKKCPWCRQQKFAEIPIKVNQNIYKKCCRLFMKKLFFCVPKCSEENKKCLMVAIVILPFVFILWMFVICRSFSCEHYIYSTFNITKSNITNGST